MAQKFSINAYKDLLSRPHVARFVFPAVLAQFPYGMLSIAVLIGVRDGYGSYTLAGLAGAITALTTSAFAPFTGRAIDRWGQRRVGSLMGLLWLTNMGLLAVALIVHPPVWVVMVMAAATGINVPCQGMLRARWRVALKNEPQAMNSALSLTSVIEESMWVLSAPIATLLATLIHPVAAILFAMAAFGSGAFFLLTDRTFEPPAYGKAGRGPISGRVVAGVSAKETVDSVATLGDVTNDDAEIRAETRAQTSEQTERRSNDHGQLNVNLSLWTAGFIALMGIQAAYGAFQSTTGIAVVAFANELNRQEWAGLVSACFSAASMIGALLYGMRTWNSSLLKRFYVFLVLLAAGCSLLVVVPNLWAAALVMFVAGLFQAPTVVNINQIVFDLVPPSRFTEGMAFQGSMWVVGMSMANLIVGMVIDEFGARGGFATVLGFALIALVIAFMAMGTLRRALARSNSS